MRELTVSALASAVTVTATLITALAISILVLAALVPVLHKSKGKH